jgi:hypothetical protein
MVKITFQESKTKPIHGLKGLKLAYITINSEKKLLSIKQLRISNYHSIASNP